MAIETTIRRSGLRTRQRILDAAMLRFSQHSYEETTLREIAADVGVDVALVHRSFGSKEELFTAVLELSFDDGLREAMAAPDLGAALTRHFFTHRRDSSLRVVDPLHIAIRSLGSERTQPILQRFVQQIFIAPLTERLGAGGEQRAALIVSAFAGLAILRDVLEVKGLRDDGRNTIQLLLEQIVTTCIAAPGGTIPHDESGLPEPG
ncbi:MAG TPA: TetR family transcriptional regulator [Rhodopseudomonas sp.]|uniref:TetR/AcrR family transcriptional regulator n=1 Tax=Rhodopseudomonas sp. TaxID=1078 RepID=UPI002ED8B93A